MESLIPKLIENLGTSALIFIIWYFTNRTFQKNLDTTTITFDKTINTITQIFQHSLDTQTEQNNRNYEVLKNLLESQQTDFVVLNNIERKIDTNQFCPIVKEQIKR